MFLCFNDRRASFYKWVMNVAASQRWYRIGPWCNATWKHSAEHWNHWTQRYEVKWPFRGFTARYDKFQRNQWLLARQRAHGEGGSFCCIFFVRFESKKMLWKYPKSVARNLLWMTVIYCGCTRLWDSSSQVSSFWSERVSNSPKRSDREEPCSSYRTCHEPLNIKTSLKKMVLRICDRSFMPWCRFARRTGKGP